MPSRVNLFKNLSQLRAIPAILGFHRISTIHSFWPYVSYFRSLEMYCKTSIVDLSSVVSALRVFALWNRNAWLFSLIFSLGLVPVVINIVSARGHTRHLAHFVKVLLYSNYHSI